MIPAPVRLRGRGVGRARLRAARLPRGREAPRGRAFADPGDEAAHLAAGVARRPRPAVRPPLRAARTVTGSRSARSPGTRHREERAAPAECGLLAVHRGPDRRPAGPRHGTIGGTTAHGDPASDTPTVLLALDAEIVARGPGGERVIPAAEFFRDVYETALGPQDVVTEIRVPRLDGARLVVPEVRPAGAGLGRRSVSPRSLRNGDAAVALTNMGATPIRARGVESAFSGDAAAAAEAGSRGDRADGRGARERRVQAAPRARARQAPRSRRRRAAGGGVRGARPGALHRGIRLLAVLAATLALAGGLGGLGQTLLAATQEHMVPVSWDGGSRARPTFVPDSERVWVLFPAGTAQESNILRGDRGQSPSARPVPRACPRSTPEHRRL